MRDGIQKHKQYNPEPYEIRPQTTLKHILAKALNCSINNTISGNTSYKIKKSHMQALLLIQFIHYKVMAAV
jgi:hypothetical protein